MFRPASYLVEWLDTPEGQAWAKLAGGLCPWIELEEDEKVSDRGQDA